MAKFFEGAGDMFEFGVEALVNPVNTRGIMGSGLAKKFKDEFSSLGMFAEYEEACRQGVCDIGKCHIWKYPNQDDLLKYVINFPTKSHWRNPSKYQFIVMGLEDLRSILVNLKIASVAIPALGCGLGGLSWTDVRGAIRSQLVDVENCYIYLYDPGSKK